MKKCEQCGIERPFLYKHHLKPQALGGTDEDGVQFLCGNCHVEVEGGPLGGKMRGYGSKTPEAKAKSSASLKAYWAIPENHERLRQIRQRDWAARRARGQVPTGTASAAYWDEHPELRDRIRSRKLKPSDFSRKDRIGLSVALAYCLLHGFDLPEDATKLLGDDAGKQCD